MRWRFRRDRPFSRGSSRRDRFRFVAASRAPRSQGGPCQRCYCPCSLMGPCGPAQIDTGCQCSPQRSVPGAHFRPYAHRPCVSSKNLRSSWEDQLILPGGSRLQLPMSAAHSFAVRGERHATRVIASVRVAIFQTIATSVSRPWRTWEKFARQVFRCRPGQASEAAHRAARRERRSGTHNHRPSSGEERRDSHLAQQLTPVVMGPRSSAQSRTRRGRQPFRGVGYPSHCPPRSLSPNKRFPSPPKPSMVPLFGSDDPLLSSANQRLAREARLWRVL